MGINERILGDFSVTHSELSSVRGVTEGLGSI